MKNLKPFNLEEALAGKAVMLRDGRKAYVRHYETEIGVSNGLQLQGVTEEGVIMAWSIQGFAHPEETVCIWDIIGMWPETHVINGFEVPAPETIVPERDTDIYIACPSVVQLYRSDVWSGVSVDKLRLERGLVFINKEDAITTAKAMLGIDPYTQEDKSHE